MHGAEIELKFVVPDTEDLRTKAQAFGFEVLTERTFEGNTLYDTPDRSLRKRKQILRLREYGNLQIVTHKRMADSSDEGSRYKTRIETESVVQDAEALAEIFLQLGYQPVFRYEKYRTEWKATGGHLVLDETPIGVWAELEGDPGWIDEVLEKFGVKPEQCSIDSYGKLFLEWKERVGSPAEDMTFAGIEAKQELAVGAGRE